MECVWGEDSQHTRPALVHLQGVAPRTHTGGPQKGLQENTNGHLE